MLKENPTEYRQAPVQNVLTQVDPAMADRPTSFDASGVGERLHQLRKERGMTLQGVAQLTEVSASTLSKIERGDLSPTIGTMQRISEGLGLDIVELLAGSPPEVPAYGRRSVSHRSGGREMNTRTCLNRLLAPDLRDKRMLPVLTRVTARNINEYGEWARSDSEIFVYVLSGTLVVHSRAYEPLSLKAGESIYYDGNVEHAWTSVGDSDAEVLWLVSAR